MKKKLSGRGDATTTRGSGDGQSWVNPCCAYNVRLRDIRLQLDCPTLGKEIGEHLQMVLAVARTMQDGFAYLDSIQGTTSALGVELHTPYLLAGICGGLDTLDRRVVTVDEERLPPGRERVLELQGVLVILTTQTSDVFKTDRWGIRAYLVT